MGKGNLVSHDTLEEKRDHSEPEALQQRITELEHRLEACTLAELEWKREEVLLQQQAQLVELARDAIIVRRLDGTITFWNRGAERLYGFGRAEAMERRSHELLKTVFPAPLPELDAILTRSGYWEGEVTHTTESGATVVVASRWVLKPDAREGLPSVMELNTDVTARKRAEEVEAKLNEELIRAQSAALRELSTPLIPINDDVLVMPLIGVMDTSRAQQVMDTLLGGIAASRARVAILDITGVSVVDSQVANALLQAARAVRLLGGQAVLTGMRPEVAITLVTLGADMGDLVTCGNLQAGIAYALKRLAA